MKNQGNHARHHVCLILALLSLMSAATLLLSPGRRASAQAVAASWSFTGSLNAARVNHTATLLPNGKVLAAGGSNYNPGGILNSAELYDSSTGMWSSTGNLNTSRYAHTATLLPNGKVLVVGGSDGRSSNPLNSAELYDPASGTWSITGNLNAPLAAVQTATLLPNGKVLVVEGYADAAGHITNNRGAELYEPTTGTWTSTGNPKSARSLHTAMLLPNGKVLVLGDDVDAIGFDTDIAELFDPATGTWSIASSLGRWYWDYTATLLPNGKVLVAGGRALSCGPELCDDAPTNSALLYDPATEKWTSTGNLSTVREGHTATLLSSGNVLVVGGSDPGNSAELYDTVRGTWSVTASLNTARVGYTETLLSNGKVLVAGGNVSGGPGTLNTAELYNPGANPAPNQIDDAQFFVQQHYLDFLNREPDAGGLAYWTNEIAQCGTDARCIHERRLGVSAAFFIELEFQDTGYYVYRFYKASFGRQPNYAEFSSDRGKVIGGSNLEANKQAFADQWVQRPAFVAAYPLTMSNTEVVNKLFDSAGLNASTYDPQRQQEIAALNAGRSRALVLRDVIEIPDFKNIPDPNDPRYNEVKQTSQYSPAFVLMQYFGYLQRDLDRIGYDFWLDVVNNREPNNYRGMVCSFVTSTEYQLRFGSLVTRSNADCSR